MSETANSWLNFLASQGAALKAEAQPGFTDFPEFPPLTSAKQGFLSALTHLGVIAVSGADAEDFLHNQLTNDVLGLDESTVRMAGYCSPKGRLLATLLIWKTGDQILMALPRASLPSVMKRLSMFVLRAKVVLKDVSDELVLIAGVTPTVDFVPPMPWMKIAKDEGALFRVPDALELQRFIWAGPVSAACLLWPRLAAQLPLASASLWRWSEIMAGLPQVVPATSEQFVPQMINYELIGGVNFRKGCYPGQEIVARSQYLGKLKRRTLLAYTDDLSAAAGMEVFSEADAGQPCGLIVNAESGPDGRMACLVEIKLDAASAAIHLRSADGPLLILGSLPYELRDPT